MSARRWWRWVSVAGLLVVVVLATARLSRWPATWFDEGMHLHVPKALVQAGVYADRSSEGFRYFGPTLGVGPTVLLPIAASFAAFGVGLLQARVVMAVFLVAFVVLVYTFGRRLGGPVVGLLSAALVIATPAPSVIEYGRQVVGEVPGRRRALAGAESTHGPMSSSQSSCVHSARRTAYASRAWGEAPGATAASAASTSSRRRGTRSRA